MPRLLCLTTLAGSACSSEAGGVELLRLEGFRPEERTAVALNEELVLAFSERVDPASLTARNLFVETKQGERARGEWTVVKRQVRFQPAPVLARDLSDGGFQPGRDYVLTVLGFPRVDGVRSLDGAPLDRCWRIGFRTVALDGGAAVLVDESPGEVRRVRFPQRERDVLKIAPLEPIEIWCEEPLDPSSWNDDDFFILAQGRGPLEEVREIAVVGRFRANHPEDSFNDPLKPCAVIELVPTEALSPDREYSLRGRRPISLTDFHGSPVSRFQSLVLDIEVESPREGTSGQVTLHFLDRTGFTPTDIPWADGLAHWGETGRLAVRYPAAAGDGAHGAVVLSGADPRTDVRATRLVVPAGEQARLPPGPGLRILRSQGRLTVAGELVRESGVAEAGFEDHPFHPGETLSLWLERVLREGRDWTVLVAGGDLCITGAVVTDTPLLLVAGGWIRIDGDVRQAPGQLWLLPDGGGAPDPSATVPKELVLDPPAVNPLVEELRYAVVTSALPSHVQDYRWVSMEVGAREGAGELRVRLLSPQDPLDPEVAVDHPGLLEGQLRVLLELVVRPGPVWDPPSVDHVILRWDPGS